MKRILDYVNPLKLYDPRRPAGWIEMLWAMVYPAVVILVLVIVLALLGTFRGMTEYQIQLIFVKVFPPGYDFVWLIFPVLAVIRRLRGIERSYQTFKKYLDVRKLYDPRTEMGSGWTFLWAAYIYPFVLMIAVAYVVGIVLGLYMGFAGIPVGAFDAEIDTYSMLVGFGAIISLFVLAAARRMRYLGTDLWMLILLFVPIVGLFVVLPLFFGNKSVMPIKDETVDKMSNEQVRAYAEKMGWEYVPDEENNRGTDRWSETRKETEMTEDREFVGKVWLDTATFVIADAMFLQGDSVDEPGQIMVNDREAVKVQGEIVEGLPSDGFYNVFVDRSNEIGWAILIEPDYEYHKIALKGTKFE